MSVSIKPDGDGMIAVAGCEVESPLGLHGQAVVSLRASLRGSSQRFNAHGGTFGCKVDTHDCLHIARVLLGDLRYTGREPPGFLSI